MAKLVVVDVEQAREELELCCLPAVLSRPDVGGQRLALAILEERRRERLLRGVAARDTRGVRRTATDQALDTVAPSQFGEGADLLIDPPRARAIGRADDDQRRRAFERRTDGGRQIGGRGKLLAILEDRRQPLAEHPQRG